ncbi:hypothetical protein [Rothia terrae]|jgi:hypothetical protein|uniref:hypothetical protein n=1 Tax=Rothia terrae TaxID=396015 RepID=UPI0033E558C0
MSKNKDFFGVKAAGPQPAENHFSLALVYSLVLVVLFAYLAVLQWPQEGIPSILHQFNSELDGGAYWISADDLGSLTRTLAWVAFAWKFAVYLTLAVLMYRLARAFYNKADFTDRVLKTLRATQITLLIGMMVYSILLEAVGRGVERASGLTEFQSVPTFWSDQGLLTLLFLTSLFFIEGALRRGLTLQQDADATI